MQRDTYREDDAGSRVWSKDDCGFETPLLLSSELRLWSSTHGSRFVCVGGNGLTDFKARHEQLEGKGFQIIIQLDVEIRRQETRCPSFNEVLWACMLRLHKIADGWNLRLVLDKNWLRGVFVLVHLVLKC